jgi:hypothetical protein
MILLWLEMWCSSAAEITDMPFQHRHMSSIAVMALVSALKLAGSKNWKT